MGSLNRDERQTLREIQAHIRASILEERAISEQVGTVDVFFHTSNPAPQVNCATPHKGVAWVRREDLLDAFAGLERLGRIPRLVFLDALFPEAFEQQLTLMGLTLEDERAVMAYHPMFGPNLPDEIPRGRLPDVFEDSIGTTIAQTRADLAAWIRVFRAAYYNTDSVRVQPDEVDPLYAAVERGETLCTLGTYENTPLGAARMLLRPPTAELEAVATAPLWYGMGIEIALITTAARAAMERGCNTVFTIAPPEEFTRLYHLLGFVDLAHMLTYWRITEI